MPSNLDLSTWTWDQVKNQYPSLYTQYGPGSPGYREPTTPAYYAPPGNLDGVVPADYDQTYGGRPIVPNPLATGQEAVLGNLANLPNLMNIVRGINPNYDTQLGIIGDQLAGLVPKDVTAQLAQQAAERGVVTGSPGSPNALANYLTRFLGTSYGMQQAGMGSASDLMSRTYGMVSPYFVTPEQMQAARMAANLYASGPIPRMAAEQSMRDIRAGLDEDRYGRRSTTAFPPTDITGGGGRPGPRETTGPLLGNQGGILTAPTQGVMERAPAPVPQWYGVAPETPVTSYARGSVARDPTARLAGGGSNLYPTFNLALGLTDPSAMGGFGQWMGGEEVPADYWTDPNNLWTDFWGYTPGEEASYGGGADTSWADPNDLWTEDWGYYGDTGTPAFDPEAWLNYNNMAPDTYSDYVTDDTGWWDEFGNDFFGDVNVSDTADLSLAPLPSSNVGDYYDWSMAPLDTGNDESWLDPFDWMD